MSVADDITSAYGEKFDALRGVYGPAGNLKFKTFAAQEPDSTLAEVTSGWQLSREEGAEVTLEVIEGAATVAGTLSESHVNDAAILEVGGRDYLKTPKSEGGVIPPTKAPRMWVIKAKLLGVQ